MPNVGTSDILKTTVYVLGLLDACVNDGIKIKPWFYDGQHPTHYGTIHLVLIANLNPIWPLSMLSTSVFRAKYFLCGVNV